MTHHRNKNVLFLGITSFFVDVSSEMILSIMPLFMSGLNISKTWIGVIEGIAEATSSILKTVSGWVSDRVQMRKPLIVVGYAVSTIVKPFLALTNFWYQVLSVRFLDRIGKGIRTSPRDALIADSIPEEQYNRAYGFNRALDTSGAVCGTLLASLLLFIFSNYFEMDALAQYRNIFWLSIIPGIFGVLTVAIFVKDVKEKVDGKEFEKFRFSSLGRRLKFFFLVSAVFELAKFSYVLFVLRASGLGIVAPLVPIVYLLYNMVYAGFSQPVGHLADRVGIRKLLIVGYLLFCFTHLGFASAEGPRQIWLFFVVYGVATAIIEVVPRVLVAHLAPEEKRGTAFGAYYTVVGLAALPATAVAGVLWDNFGAEFAFTYGAAVTFVALVLFMAGFQEHHLKRPSAS